MQKNDMGRVEGQERRTDLNSGLISKKSNERNERPTTLVVTPCSPCIVYYPRVDLV